MMSTDIDRLLNLLMHESAQARDDDRYMSTQFATIISVALGLVLAMAALFYQTCPEGYCTDDKRFTPLPIWIYVSAPILPTVLVTYAVLLATLSALRSYYIRTIEVKIHQLTNQDPSEIPIPSWGHLNLDVNGQIRARGFAGLSWWLIYVIIALLLIGCVYLIASKIPVARYRVFALVVHGSLLVIPAVGGVMGTARGANLWEQALAALPGRLSRTSAQFPSTRVSTERSLTSFLLLPRNQEELLKALFIPISFLIGRMLAPRLPSLTAGTLWYLFGFLLTFEFLVYQARYLLNDVRDRRVDCSNSLSKRRFPCSRVDDPVALMTAFMSFVARLAFALLLVGCVFPLENGRWVWHLGFLIGVLLIAAPYETARSKCVAAAKAGSSSRTERWAKAVVGIVGLGYGLRAVVGLWLAGVEGIVALVLVAVAGSLFGSTFVALAWALESTRSRREELTEKAHLMLFQRTVSEAAKRSNFRIGPTERVLAGRQSLTAPWCVTAILATAALVSFSLFLLHHRVDVGKSLWIGGAVVMVAGLAVVTPVKLSWGLTMCSMVGVGIVLHVLSVSAPQSIVAAAVSVLALIVMCVNRGMCFEDMTECISKVVKSVERGVTSVYWWFQRTR